MKIEKSKYTGYLWYSDQKKPEIIYGDKDFGLEISDAENPFIIEGQLCDGKNSISIKFVDGKYIVKTYTLSDYEDVKADEYVANRMDNVEKLLFKRVWKPKEDGLCCGMVVNQPAELVFVGLKMKEDRK